MNRFERQVRNLINPYSTAFARWWCHSGRYLSPAHKHAAGPRRPGRARPGRARPGPAKPGANPGIPDAVICRSSADFWLAAQAARRAAVDEVLASLDDGGEEA
jgi:hypothetical protein